MYNYRIYLDGGVSETIHQELFIQMDIKICVGEQIQYGKIYKVVRISHLLREVAAECRTDLFVKEI